MSDFAITSPSDSGSGNTVINLGQPPEFEKRTSVTAPTTGKDTTTKPVTPEETAAEGKIAGLTQDEIALQGRQAQQNSAVASATADEAQRQQFIEEGLAAQRTGPEAMAAKAYLDQMRVHVRDEQDKLSKMPPASLFADRDAWGKVRGVIGLGLAGLGDGVMAAAAIRAGHAPTNRNTVGEIIDRDLQRQREAIDRQKDSVVMARTGLKDADEARRALLADIELRGSQMAKHSEAILKTRLAALKMDQAAIDNTKEVLDLKRKQAEHEAEFAKLHGTTVVNKYDGAKVTNETINRFQNGAGPGGKIEKDVVFDENGNPIGRVPSGRGGAAAFDTRDADYGRAEGTLQRLLDDVDKNGSRVLDPDAIKRRNSLYDNAVIGVATVSPLGKTEEAQKLEAGSLGSAGAPNLTKEGVVGTVAGANRDAIARKLSEIKEQRQRYRTQTLLPLTPEMRSQFTPAATPVKAAPAEFSPDRVEIAKKIATDKSESRERRDRARAYIKAAAAKGVK